MAAALFMLMSAALQLAPPVPGAALAPPDSGAYEQGSNQSATSNPTSRPEDPLIESLITELGATDFRRRTAAQKRLTELGAAALPGLIRHINNPSPEIAERVQSIVQTPVDPSMRVDLAVALLATRRPEAMERAVYMMFDTPEPCYEPFVARVATMKGRDRVVGEAIAEQYRAWHGHYLAYKRNNEKSRNRSEEATAHLKKLQTETTLVHAEAAFQLGLEALESTEPGAGGRGPSATTSQPADGVRPIPASQGS